MAQVHAGDTSDPDDEPAGIRGRVATLALAIAGVCVLLLLVALLGSGSHSGGPGSAAGGPALPSPTPIASVDPAAFLYQDVRAAPDVALVDPAGSQFALTSLRGDLVLVFFGYTHCPDVCPATVGTVGVAMSAFGPGVQAVFVTVDPERDTAASLAEYSRYLPKGFTALTGDADQIRATAAAWGVKYARVETGVASGYSMSHTADVYLVDETGDLRGHFPFGTESAAMTATMRLVASTTSASSSSAPASTTPSGSRAPSALELRPEILSSSVWAGDQSPIILALFGPGGRVNDTSAHASVQLEAADGTPVGGVVPAVAVKPPGLDDVSFVASMAIPSPGAWRFAVSAQTGALPLLGSTGLVTALDQGATPAIGTAAPTIHTPTVDDADGDIRAVSTDPIPDRRLSTRSTSDALAQHVPFVLVLDSNKFRVTSACGRALVMAKYLVDRWPEVTFIHHEPYRYSIVTDTQVLDGALTDPPLTDVAVAWGLGSGPWDATSMPWVFVVDGRGIVRAKYQGVLGSEDVDVTIALIR